jgi:hypothetical protein
MDANTPDVFNKFEELPEHEQNIINKTIDAIETIFEDSASKTYESIGELVFENIFENSPESAWEINEATTKDSKVKLFKQLEEEIAKRSGDKVLPKKTWLYNSVNLVLDKRRLTDVPEFEKYNQLSISHKIELLSIKDLNKKIILINEIHDNKLSVRDTRNQIGQSSDEKHAGILTYIKDPGKIVNVDDIILVGGKKKDAALIVANNKITELKNELKNKEDQINKLTKLVERLNNHNPVKGRKKKED